MNSCWLWKMISVLKTLVLSGKCYRGRCAREGVLEDCALPGSGKRREGRASPGEDRE
jgi:hypothetical protein